MKIWKLFLTALLFGIIAWPLLSLARSGCCSSHGGVCGCECCDGSSLSAICAPYYPECNDDPEPYNPFLNDTSVTKILSYDSCKTYTDALISCERNNKTLSDSIAEKYDKIKSQEGTLTQKNNEIGELKKSVNNRNTWIWWLSIGLVIAIFNIFKER